MGIQLVSRRRRLSPIERVLLALALSMCGWHSSNLVITLHGLFGFGYTPAIVTVLRIADTVAVISIMFCYSFLLHVHIHLWANAAERALKRSEKIRIYLSYLTICWSAVRHLQDLDASVRAHAPADASVCDSDGGLDYLCAGRHRHHRIADRQADEERQRTTNHANARRFVCRHRHRDSRGAGAGSW